MTSKNNNYRFIVNRYLCNKKQVKTLFGRNFALATWILAIIIYFCKN